MTEWKILSFKDLSTFELYELLKVRQQVFVVEQNCVYLDNDGENDYLSYHVLALENDSIAAYARIIPPKINNNNVSIGRVLTASNFRGKGYGKRIIATCLEYIDECFLDCNVQISAQLYLLKFYETFGFKKVSDVYLEDGIKHIKMIR